VRLGTTSTINDPAFPASLTRLVGVVSLGWLAMLGIDFFLHGGLLAALWLNDSPFLLPPTQTFSLIPVGYAAFLLLAVLLLWLMLRLEIAGWLQGLIFGLKMGLLTAGALVLALFSASTAELPMLAGWFVGQSLEMAAAGAVIGAALAGVRLWRLLVIVILADLVLAIATVVMQSLGLAPAARI
jgi:hypothetical protein